MKRLVLGALFGALLLAVPSALGSHTPQPTSVTIAGSLQSELGCPGDWQPECAATHLTREAADGVWQGTFTVPAGNWEYKAPLNDSWTENYGLHAQANGANIPLTLGAATAVKFYYDHESHWITDGESSTIAVAAGSFQSEVGCPGDWQPDCLRSWLQDSDGDGTYGFTTSAIPAGNYAFKVALDEGWSTSYPAADVPFSVNAGDVVTFTYVAATNAVDVAVEGGGIEPGDESLVRPSLRRADSEVFYFVLPDRFDDASDANDRGGLAGDRMATGFDPTDKGFYHGGDLGGLLRKLDYIEGLGITAIWMAPIFQNRPVQGEGANASAGYHGYWITDFTKVDPHFGTNAELKALVDGAHARGIKVFFDVITNHTADVIDYAEREYLYRNKNAYPYFDASGREFDDRDYAGTNTFPALDAATSFPYTPVFPSPADATVKAPAWLNDRTMYHNRGNSTFAGESSLYGDFFGLDDLFTERPEVVRGMIGIYSFWVDEVGIDGYRIDTAKHVNNEFWQAWSPALVEHAAAKGIPHFFMFGEVFDSNPEFTSTFTTEAKLQAVLDFPFQSRARSFASGSATDGLRDLFAQDDLYTDADSNAYSLPTFLGNHDMGRIGNFVRGDNAGANDAELLARDGLAHALMYLVRGQPVVYYGDEQGFTGDGGDKDARSDMFGSEVASYNDDDLIGTDATTATPRFDTAHALYGSLAELAGLRETHQALAHGTQVHRVSDGAAGVYAFSRILRGPQVEYVVALNNAETERTVAIPTYSNGSSFSGVWPDGLAPLTTSAAGALNVTVPPLAAVVYRANAPLAASASAPNVTVTAPAEGATVLGRVEVGAALSRADLAEVTFAVKAGGASEWTVLGTDDNPPYRVYHDVSGLAPGTALAYKAIVRDHSGNLDSDTGTAVVGTPPSPPGAGATRDYAVVHYVRADGDYGPGGYGLHVWGDVDEPAVDWTHPKQFDGADAYGRFTWIKLAPDATSVGFIVHKGDTKDVEADRFFNPSQTPEIWLKEGDPAIYTSRAAAQGFAELRYHRPDGTYAGWGLHLWGDAIADGVATDWASPRLPDRVDDYGAYWKVPLKDASKPLNFIVHRGDEKDTAEDRAFVPADQPEAWLQSGDSTVHRTRGAAEDFVILHYHRPDGAYGDHSSSDFNDFWGMHVWEGSAEPGIEWTRPLKPVGRDGFGLVFKVRLVDAAPVLAYILHRGDTKDLGKDQFLDLTTLGHEVWYLSQQADSDGNAKYLLPMLGGPGVDANLGKAKAHWLSRDTVAWKLDPVPGGRYSLNWAPDGGLAAGPDGLTGGQSIRIFRARGLSDGLKARFPHLAGFGAFQIAAEDLAKVPEALKGQLAVSVVDADGALRAATGVQIPGVLDDLYANDLQLGPVVGPGTTTLRVWAPTARSVALRLYDGDAFQTLAMSRDDATGTWSAAGGPSWLGKAYLYDVEVYAPSTGKAEHNLATDPYSLALTTNSARSLIVDLGGASLEPQGWDALRKPALRAFEDVALYELHVRDFSISDSTVPKADRGTYRAFTHDRSDGMKHLGRLAQAGLTHVHLLPVFDIATIDEVKANWLSPGDLSVFGPASEEQQARIAAIADKDAFNWGYDPWHYTVPEGSYATDPQGAGRTREFREMVRSLNKADLRVVMDVVYNHTNASGQAERSVLDRIVPGYYHRLLEDGAVATSTCCQNTATEHAMMEKLMVDSVVTWAKAYKVDGFRFDLMGHHSKANMLKVRAALDALTPAADGVDGKSIWVYGEGWNFGEVANDARFVQATQLNLAGTGIGTFNDRLRDAVRGGGPFDDDPRIQGFASGLYTDPNAMPQGTPEQQLAKLLLHQDQIRVGLTGNLKDFTFVDRTGATVKGSRVDYNGSPAGYNADPQEAITYVEAHDNETLFDAYAAKLPQDTPVAARVRAQLVALSIVALGQGVPFFHAGGELLRSKSMDKNSFNSGDWFNRLFFDLSSNNFAVGLPPAGDNGSRYEFLRPILSNPSIVPSSADIERSVRLFGDLLQIRRTSRLFRLGDAATVQQRLTFPGSGPMQPRGLIAMRISDEAAPDLDPKHESVVVLFNGSDETRTVTVPDAKRDALRLHPVQMRAGDPVVRRSSFDRATGTFSVPPRTTAVFVELGNG